MCNGCDVAVVLEKQRHQDRCVSSSHVDGRIRLGTADEQLGEAAIRVSANRADVAETPKLERKGQGCAPVGQALAYGLGGAHAALRRFFRMGDPTGEEGKGFQRANWARP